MSLDDSANRQLDGLVLSKTTTRVGNLSSSTISQNEDVAAPAAYPPRDHRFWLVFVALDLATLLTALELSMVGPALPTIVHDLGSQSFIWVGSAYALVATASIPLSGGFAHSLGRKQTLLTALFVLAAGSLVCALAKSMNVLIAGRAIQGLGGGSVASLTYIVVSDMVPLRERGVFNSILSIAWAVGLASGPVLGGALAQSGKWRWVFYLNLPVCGVAAAVMAIFLRQAPLIGSPWQKLKGMDWSGIVLFGAGSTSTAIALTWAGIQYAWNTAQVIVPLVLGLAILLVCYVYEAKFAKNPVVPVTLMSTRTAVSGYIQTFIWPILMVAIAYYMPVYFQAVQLLSPVSTGVHFLVLGFVPSVFSVAAGLSVRKTGIYRPQLWLGWLLIIPGVGVLSLLKFDSPLAMPTGIIAIVGAGFGIVNTTTQFPVLAPLSASQNALALSYFAFLRHFAQVWGVTIGGTILQNALLKKLPAAVLATSGSTAVAFQLVAVVRDLPHPLRDEVRRAFAESLVEVWHTMTGIAGIGLMACVLMRGISLDGMYGKPEDTDATLRPVMDAEKASEEV